MAQMKRSGIIPNEYRTYGRSFDPPHNGHHEIVSGLLTKNIADEIWLIPTKKHAFSNP